MPGVPWHSLRPPDAPTDCYRDRGQIKRDSPISTQAHQRYARLYNWQHGKHL